MQTNKHPLDIVIQMKHRKWTYNYAYQVVWDIKKETNKSLKEIEENITKPVNEKNKMK